MTAKEVRDYRNVCKKLIEVEEKTKLFQVLRKQGVNIPEEEYQVQKVFSKFKVLGEKRGVLTKKHEEMMSLSLNLKIKDNNLYGGKLRRKKNWLRGKLEESLGKKEYRKLEDDVRQYGSRHRKHLKEKHKRKAEHLVKKFGEKSKLRIKWEDLKRR